MIKNITLLILINTLFCITTGFELANLIDSRIKPANLMSNNTMTIINKKGREKTLELKTKSKDNNKRQMIWFLSPPDDRGMSFLKIENEDKDDLMKMWFPGFKKLRRISSSKKSDSFMGSDLSFEDLTNRNLNDYKYKLISANELCEYKNEEIPCFALESIPNIKSGYSKHITWAIKLNKTYLAIKEHSFDNESNLLKIKTIEFIEKITDTSNYYIMNKLNVENIQKNTSTSLIVNNIEINLDVKDSDFNDMNLKRLP